MNEQSIQKQYNQIVSLLEYKRLKEASFSWMLSYIIVMTGLCVTAWNKSRLPISICCNT